MVEREEDGLPGPRGGRVFDADRPPERIADDRLLAGAPRQLRVELGLETRQTDVVDARKAEHLRRHRVLRIRAPLFAVEVEARELLLREHARLGGRRLSVHVGEVRCRTRERVVDGLDVQAERARSDLRFSPRVRDCRWIDEDGGCLLTKCERRAHAVEDRPARGGQDDRRLRLDLSCL